jgi:hypothetical protein
LKPLRVVLERLEYCLEKSLIVLELPRGWKVVQLIYLEVKIIWKSERSMLKLSLSSMLSAAPELERFRVVILASSCGA